MPLNLPAEAIDAEHRYRQATTVEEKIACIEELLSHVPKHKGTDRYRADYRKRLSKLKSAAQSSKKTSGQRSPFQIDREGAGQVVVIGMTNVGKSALVDAVTNATPDVSPAPFTTWAPTPGMMEVGGAQIQLIDTPPLNRDYIDPEHLNLLRRCDLILLVVDVQTHPVQQLEESIEILEENRIVASHRVDSYTGEGRIVVKPLLVVANQCDDDDCDEVFEILQELLEEDWPMLPISATGDRNLSELGWAIFEKLRIMRIYSKAPGEEPKYGEPFVMERGGTVEQFARKIHKDFYDNLRAARVWGSSTFDGQQVQRDYVLHDQDIVELRT
jgi:small GTP-binding protein